MKTTSNKKMSSNKKKTYKNEDYLFDKDNQTVPTFSFCDPVKTGFVYINHLGPRSSQKRLQKMSSVTKNRRIIPAIHKVGNHPVSVTDNILL